jgi:membrane protein implicated in regulation of membrane protease activity
VAEAVGNSVVTAVVGSIYAALLVSQPQALGYTLALAATLLVAIAAAAFSRRVGHIHNALLESA